MVIPKSIASQEAKKALGSASNAFSAAGTILDNYSGEPVGVVLDRIGDAVNAGPMVVNLLIQGGPPELAWNDDPFGAEDAGRGQVSNPAAGQTERVFAGGLALVDTKTLAPRDEL